MFITATESTMQANITPHWDTAVNSFRQGQMAETVSACKKVLEVEPGHFGSVFLLGKAARRMGQHELAENLLQAALALRPGSIEVLNELGAVLNFLKKHDQALGCYLQVLEALPHSAQAQFNASALLYDAGQLQDALELCRTASIGLQTDFLTARIRLGMILYSLDDLHASLASLQETLHWFPDDIGVLNMIALNKISLGLPDEALPYLEQVLKLHPEDTCANNRKQEALGLLQETLSVKETLYNSGLIEEAEQMARDDLKKYDSVENHNFLLKCYLVNPSRSAHDYLQESKAWAEKQGHTQSLPSHAHFENNRDPHRRLRVGIVGDYFLSVIGAFTLYPFFRLYNRDIIELYCYNFGPDGEQLLPVVDHYRDIRHFNNDEFFELVRNDVIDIMLDINGRLRTPNYFDALLRQPAPIQVNWYNLTSTVGVEAFNYVIADDYSIRKDEEDMYVEKVFRMPTGMISGWAMGMPPLVPEPPCIKNGYVTFGCFGNFFKINKHVLSTWVALLHCVPNSRLYMKSDNLRFHAERERVSKYFQDQNIDPARLIMEGVSTYKQMRVCYEWVDIAIDTFPYSSGSTTINALWQGIPVIAIEGNDWRSRNSASILAGAKLDDFIARDVNDYLDKICALAANPENLAKLRQNLGKHMASSPQWNVEAFARNFESQLRMIWMDWLEASK